ncbi:MAG: ATP-binding cassette domain-containing protein [Candidatus Aminicenantes bacterium]|nr:ATP-binding cassette domain-containing protein [Candidatus Aminicenantes bacterium]
MISADSLSKSYGEQVLFENISFKINRRERVGLVGRNGHGKTTLFRLITGLEEPDTGSIAIPRHYRIGYVEQTIDFTEETVLLEAGRGLPPDGHDQIWRVEKILAGLGFGPKDLDKHPAELSGGYQVRLNLTKILLADYNMLLLDEPNNYLDITSIRWLERFLLSWPGELMLITHDRSFMDKVVTHTLAIHRRKIKKIGGDTSKLYDQIALEEETYEKTRINDERKRKEIQEFIDKFHASAQLTGLVQSRKKTLSKMVKREKLEKLKSLEFGFGYKPFHGKYVLSVQDLAFGYEPERPLIKDFGITIGARDRVFVIGKNGRGKTTLLKLMAGVLEPDQGEIAKPMAVAPGYFEQTNVQSLGDHNTVLEEIGSAAPDIEPSKARYLSGLMMFEGNNALKKISVLSGGEKSRVLLGKLIATPLNLILLDEPTNHLDMEASDALLSAIDNFKGAVIMVTHNELFLDALAERLIVFQGDGVSMFEGTYQRFLEKVGWEGEDERERPEKKEVPDIAEKLGKKELRKLRTDLLAERAAVLKPLENKMRELEQALQATENEANRLTQEIVEASRSGAGARIGEMSKTVHQLRKMIDAYLEELEPVLKDHESRKADFDKRLEDLAAKEPV